ncbi:unnamed protein product [Lactuca saligna]|uniref:Xylanase inhibitor N-terminal domain-containing protein n=1 Tax=Lactuca saligna TaxID=75948 RepID=A0AA36DWI9_LACSI|nr:unnamed protein product [Lactuca saligna]
MKHAFFKAGFHPAYWIPKIKPPRLFRLARKSPRAFIFIAASHHHQTSNLAPPSREQQFRQECQIHDTGFQLGFPPPYSIPTSTLYAYQIGSVLSPLFSFFFFVFSASIVFGCSTSQTRVLTKADRAIDEIFGFGQQGQSVIAQLSSQGIAPDAFPYCLVGNGGGGGILVLGQIIEPTMVYTPLIQSQL